MDGFRRRVRRTGKTSKRGRGGDEVREWVGGRVTAPFVVTEGTPFRPEMILWMELPERVIVAGHLVDPKAPPVSFGATLLQAMRSPMVGSPRRPSRVRVNDRRLAAEVREVEPEMGVTVAPTPELDLLLRLMASDVSEDACEEAPSYFEGSRVSLEAVESLFGAAGFLFSVAPWKVANDCDVLRLDIPALGVEGACVSIIGALGQNLGLLIFPSRAVFDRFLEEAESKADSRDRPIDFGGAFLSLNFERAAALPPSLRSEADRYGWTVASPDAYPVVERRDRDGMLLPFVERDVRVVSACATSLAAFFVKHGDLFERNPVRRVCESFFDEKDLEVRFTLPYEVK